MSELIHMMFDVDWYWLATTYCVIGSCAGAWIEHRFHDDGWPNCMGGIIWPLLVPGLLTLLWLRRRDLRATLPVARVERDHG